MPTPSLHRYALAGLTALAMLLCLAAAPQAEPPHHGGPHGPESREPDHRGDPHWAYDDHFHHNHYYPVRGAIFVDLPPSRLRIAFGPDIFFFSAGIWYRPEGPRYIVVAPPPGIIVPVLPPYYTMVYVSGVPYYYANEIYYQPAPGGYAVAVPPPGTVSLTPPVPAAPPAPPAPAAPPAPQAAPPARQVFIYPRNGQGAKKIEADRTACTRWAVEQSGYDPDAAGYDANRNADFQRAFGACLEGRGYTVR